MITVGKTRIRPGPSVDVGPVGTIGLVAAAPHDGGSTAPELYLITCGHVLAPTTMSAPPTDIVDAETSALVAIEARATLPTATPNLDVGIARLVAPCDPGVPDLGPPAAIGRDGDFESDAEAGAGQGVPLRVFGAASRQLVNTRLIERDATATVRYRDPAGRDMDIPLSRQFIIEAGALRLGDSGAPVLAGGFVAGIFVGFDLADSRRGVVTPIGAVMAEASRLAGIPLHLMLDFSRVREQPGDLIDGAAPSAVPAPIPPAGTTKAVPYTEVDIAATLAALGLDEADWPLLAGVLAVESAGFGFLADRRPKILFERHVFSRLTAGRFDGEAPNISSPQAGGYFGGPAEHDRLNRARDLCQQAGLSEELAVKSASWGLGQVMGFNHLAVGFPSAGLMIAAFETGEAAQLAAIAAFIIGKGLDAPLREEDWHRFAHGYNGANYAAHNYHGKLVNRVGEARAGRRPDPALRRVQTALLYLRHLDHPSDVDGIDGHQTALAIRGWQAKNGQPQTGTLAAGQIGQLLAEAAV